LSTNRRHLKQVETLRAMAALSVAIFHFSAYFTWSENITSNFTLGAQGVEVFYLISGFIIPFSLFHTSYKIQDYFKYMGKRLIRLLPPYILTIILIQVVGIALCTFLWGCDYDINFRQIAINVFFLADLFPTYDWINPIFATLEVELQFYLIIGLLFIVFKRWSWSFTLISIGLLFIGILTKHLDTVLVNSPYFLTGVSLFFIKEKGWKWEYVVSLIFIFISLFKFYMWQDLGAALIGFSLLLFLPDNIKFLNYTGKISYSYYLVHGLSGGWFLFFTAPTQFGQHHPLVLMLFALIISWIAAFIIYYTIERVSMKFSKKISYGK
jgi:peptidoglycan/LPS O-acetylase OafA/YrhL